MDPADEALCARARSSIEAARAELALSPSGECVREEPCLPIARWIVSHARAPGCRIIGLAGAQGSGKSTLAALLARLLSEVLAQRTVVLSLDDYYLPRAERAQRARDVHPLLRTRGVPGTHDVDALGTALRTLRTLGAGERMEILRFDKAHDDRARETKVVEGPIDVVLFEGWCVGARAQHASALSAPVNALERDEDADARFRTYVNEQLAQRYEPLWRELDGLVFLAVPDVASVFGLRAEQERKLRATTRGASAAVMDDTQLARFVQHFERLTAHMLHEAPAYADVLVRLDRDRQVTSLTLRDPASGASP